jgi:UPF0755 protein
MRLLRLVFIAALLALVVAGAFAWHWLRQPLPLPASPYGFEVRPGATLSAVARQLRDAGVLEYPIAMIALARVKGVDRTIKAGSYEVEAGATLPQVLAQLTQGDVRQSSLTVIEGTTFAELKRALADTSGLTHALAALSDAELLAKLGISEASAEGLFFPDTYFFATGSSDVALLKRARRALAERLDAGWQKRAADLPFAAPYEALILASIVEKETGRAFDRPAIASVFVNRLKRGMRLQTDPTVIYGLGAAFDGNLRKRDLEADTPYNTYTRDGLPPTPIALPSQASLDAVLNPPPTPYLYFVSRGDGTSEFSANLADHNRAVSKYQKGGR